MSRKSEENLEKKHEFAINTDDLARKLKMKVKELISSTTLWLANNRIKFHLLAK
ncbi:hypothetical protein OROHE_001722 [Orobanche hederae]